MTLDLDRLARRISPAPQSAAELEMARRSLVSALATASPPRRGWFGWAMGGVLATAIAILLISSATGGQPEPSSLATSPAVESDADPSWSAAASTNFLPTRSGRSARLDLVAGELTVNVPAGASASVITERFVATSTEGQFSVVASATTGSVRVLAGRVVITASGAQLVRVSGESWSLPLAEAPPVGPRPVLTPATPARPARATSRDAVPPPSKVATDAPIAAPRALGLAEFRDARALSARGDHHGARIGFADAAARSDDPALVAEATFWAAISAHRAGDIDATAALEDFASRHPGSTRRGQIALLLGQRFAGARDLGRARRWLTIARSDASREVAARADELLASLPR